MTANVQGAWHTTAIRATAIFTGIGRETHLAADASQAVGAIHSILPARAIVHSMVNEAARVLEHRASFVQGKL